MSIPRTAVAYGRTIICTIGLIFMPAFARGELVTRLETFDVDPGWSTAGNGANGNSFGYRTSSFAGGNAGEGGGRFTRSDFVRFYGDTNLGGTLTLDRPFSASGLLDFTERNRPDFGQPFFLGHFNSTALNAENRIGLAFGNTINANELSWGIELRLSDASSVSSEAFIISANVDRVWSYAWNPTGGIHGTGQLTGSLSGPGGGTITLDLPPELRVKGASFDSFGLNGGFPSPPAPQPSEYADLFIDNVAYSTALELAAVPEPATFAMFLCGLSLLALKRRRLHRGSSMLYAACP